MKCLCVSNVSPDWPSSHQQLRRRMWLRLLPVIKMMLNMKSCRNRTRQLASTVKGILFIFTTMKMAEGPPLAAYSLTPPPRARSHV